MPAPPSRDLEWLYDTKEIVRALPLPVRVDIGKALRAVQNGGMPTHFDVLSTLGKGLTEIKTRHDGEAYRTFYVVGSTIESTGSTSSTRNRSRVKRSREKMLLA